MQAACPRAVFERLEADFGVAMELFASPLNARFRHFGSAAAEVDAPFGSLGSFFALPPRSPISRAPGERTAALVRRTP